MLPFVFQTRCSKKLCSKSQMLWFGMIGAFALRVAPTLVAPHFFTMGVTQTKSSMFAFDATSSMLTLARVEFGISWCPDTLSGRFR